MGMGGATEIEMVTLFLSRLVERCCSSRKEKFLIIHTDIQSNLQATCCQCVCGCKRSPHLGAGL